MGACKGAEQRISLRHHDVGTGILPTRRPAELQNVLRHSYAHTHRADTRCGRAVSQRTTAGRSAGAPDVQDDDLGAVQQQRGHVARVLLVPAQAQQRLVGLRALVNDGAVLLVPAAQARQALGELPRATSVESCVALAIATVITAP